MNHFRASAHVPPGLAIAIAGDIIVFFGPMAVLADKMEEGLPSNTMIHCSMKDYLRISKGALKAAPNAPSIEAQNREFSGRHLHPDSKLYFQVSDVSYGNDEWVWRIVGKPATDHTRYPTAEGAYLAALGD